MAHPVNLHSTDVSPDLKAAVQQDSENHVRRANGRLQKGDICGHWKLATFTTHMPLFSLTTLHFLFSPSSSLVLSAMPTTLRGPL